ncbi:glycoside hydrolase family 6 protein [Miltoncostaea oceani]|uniref:glycoside hydrolase family 6 protein n=1 Tax=Miltoncostaea oceani TaxID=2843216 RepID=UPI001C3E611E|nr:glycoside hydrolase family 6 protein [Miltoncostaea oceani]
MALRLICALTLAAAAASVSSPSPAFAAPNPFAVPVLVDQASAAHARMLEMRRAGDGRHRAVARIARQPQAFWMTGPERLGELRDYLARAKSSRRLALVVVYAVPGRDCGSHSAGGASDTARYLGLVRQVSRTLSSHRAAVILEPDAIAGADCLDAAGRQARYGQLSRAGRMLSAGGRAVYLDAGHSSWHDAQTMAVRLRASGVSRLRGFALNVSNHQTDTASIAYGQQLRRLLGGSTRFVIDSSRNGAGPAPEGAWCNPPGRRLGRAPRVSSLPGLDAFAWIKRPGESDGTCNGGPQAGRFSDSLALSLAR